MKTTHIQQTATNITMSVNNEISNVRAAINVESNRISLVVEGTGSNAYIKPAAIVAAINDGGSSIVISADHINLDGYVKASDITADFLEAKIAGITSLGVQNLAASGSISIKDGGSYYAIQRSLEDAQVVPSGNGYKLQYKFLFTI